MKKIALLTFHDTTNFGALLQTFGLYTCLNRLGYDCHILNYQCENIIRREIPKGFRFSINPKMFAKELFVNSKHRKRYAAIKCFSDKYMNKITKRYNRETIFNNDESFDAYVVGSDMLWGLDVTGGDYSYFLDFVTKDSVKCSFGTSIGAEWTAEEINDIKILLNDFKYISVREDYTALKLRTLLNRDCDVVCDPTLLLTGKDWLPYVSNRYKGKNFVLVYFESDNKKNLYDARTYAYNHNLDVYYVGAGFSFNKNEKQVYPSRVEDFLSLLYYADTIFTASYHGMLFGLYFNKQLVYYNRQPSYRMDTAADKLGVRELEGSKLDISNGIPRVNYAEVNAKIDKYRSYSITKITEALS